MIGNPSVDRKARQHLATKKEILDAAWSLARASGLAGFSLRDLGARVGMRQPSIYTYFASKSDIYDAMFQGAWQGLLETMQATRFPEDLGAALRVGSHVFVEYMLADPARFQLMAQRPVPGFIPSARAFAPSVASLGLFARELASRGISDPRAVDMWTAILAGLISQQVANEPGGRRWADLVDDAVAMFVEHTQGAVPEVTQ